MLRSTITPSTYSRSLPSKLVLRYSCMLTRVVAMRRLYAIITAMSQTSLNQTSDRRNFLKTAATAALTAAGATRVLGANDRIRLGIIGPGERGRYDMSRFLKFPDVEIVALCDAWDD